MIILAHSCILNCRGYGTNNTLINQFLTDMKKIVFTLLLIPLYYGVSAEQSIFILNSSSVTIQEMYVVAYGTEDGCDSCETTLYINHPLAPSTSLFIDDFSDIATWGGTFGVISGDQATQICGDPVWAIVRFVTQDTGDLLAADCHTPNYYHSYGSFTASWTYPSLSLIFVHFDD